MNQKDWDSYYVDGKPFWQMSDEVLDSVLAHVGPLHSAIDLGCGRGELCEQLMKRGLKVTGVDFSETAISDAKKRLRDVTFIKSDLEMPFETGSYDIAFSKLVIPFLKNPKKFLLRCHEFARVCVLITPLWSDTPPEDVHAKSISMKEQLLNEAIAESGYSNIEIFRRTDISNLPPLQRVIHILRDGTRS